MNLEHSPSIQTASKITAQLLKKKAEESEFPGPGPANYTPGNYDNYIKRTSIVKARVKQPSIARLNITLKLYDPKWAKGLVGKETPQAVSPSSYRPTFSKRSSPARFQNEKTNRLIKI